MFYVHNQWYDISCVSLYIYIYVYTQQYSTIVSNYNLLFCAWRHVSAAHTAIFRPAYSRKSTLMRAQYGIPHCLHMKYM